MNEGRVIELDGDWDLLESPLPPRSRRISRWRAAAATVLALICLASLGASRRPPQPLFQLLGFFEPATQSGGQNPGDVMLLAGMLVTQQDGRVVAYAPDGRLRWTVRVQDNDQEGYLNVRMWRGLVLIEQYQPVLAPSLDVEVTATGKTYAIDPGTGAEMWRMPGFVEPVNDVVLLHNGAEPVKVYGTLPSGLLWTVPPSRTFQVDLKTNALFTLADDGLLTEFDLTTGAVRASGKVQVPHVDPPIAAQVPAVGRYPDELAIDVFKDRIILRSRYYSENGFPIAQSFTYDRTTLQRTFSPVENYDGTQDCGPVLCAYNDQRVSIVDPEDLTILWQPAEATFPYWTGDAMVVTDQSGLESMRVVEPRTGETLVDLTGWNPAEERLHYGRSAMRWLTRYAKPGFTYVAELKVTGLHVLGPLPYPVVHCQSEELVLACAMSDGRLGVWRINA